MSNLSAFRELKFQQSVEYDPDNDESSRQRSASVVSIESGGSQQMALQELKEECYEMTVQQDALKDKYEFAKRKAFEQHFELQSNLQIMFTKYISNIESIYLNNISILKQREKQCEQCYKSLSKTPRGRKGCYDANDPYSNNTTSTVPEFDFSFASQNIELIEEIENYQFEYLNLDGIIKELKLLNNNLILNGAWCLDVTKTLNNNNNKYNNINNINNINNNINNNNESYDDGDEGIVDILHDENILNEFEEIINNTQTPNGTPNDTPGTINYICTPEPEEADIEVPTDGIIDNYNNYNISIYNNYSTPTIDPYGMDSSDGVEFRSLKMGSSMDRTGVIDTPRNKKNKNKNKKPGLNRVQSEQFTNTKRNNNMHPVLKNFNSTKSVKNNKEKEKEKENTKSYFDKKRGSLLMQSTTQTVDEINTDSREYSSVRSIWEQMARKGKANKTKNSFGRKRSCTSNN